MKKVFIINAKAGNGQAKQIASYLNEIFYSNNDVNIVYTKDKTSTIVVAEHYKNQDCVIYSVGGDGTLNDVVTGLAGGNAYLGILPCGSGNDFMRNIDDKTAEIDLGKVNDTYFINVVSFGIDAEVANKANEDYKENATKVLNEAIKQIKDASKKIKDDEELKRIVDNISRITEDTLEGIKKQYSDFINDPKVQQSYNDVKEQVITMYEKLQDNINIKINSLKENEKFMNTVNDINESIDAGIAYASEKINEFTSRPEVNEKIEKAKDVAIDLAEKSTEALKNWLRPNNKDNK